MSHLRLRILFLPADSIEPSISRSYYLAHGLSHHADVFYVVWSDPRSAHWQGKSRGIGHTLKCTGRSLLQRFRIEEIDVQPHFYRVSCSILLDAIVHRIVGRTLAAKAKYAYNRRVLNKLVRRLQPDVVFHADGFYYFPAVEGPHVAVSDIQDDIDWASCEHEHAKFLQSILYAGLRRMHRAYIVSDAAKDNMNRHLPSPTNFSELANGADFDQIRKVSPHDVECLRERLGLSGKYVASYIGGSVWFDRTFASAIFTEAAKVLPDVHFVIVGAIPPMSFPNVTWVGHVTPEVAASFYNLSDVGMFLRDSGSDPFLFNSVPLKIVQYSAARKPVIAPKLNWVTNGDFLNVFTMSTTEAGKWCECLNRIRNDFVWTPEMESIWQPYSWDAISQRVINDLNSFMHDKPQKTIARTPARTHGSSL